MKCHYCCRELGVTSLATGDPDFCSSSHRAKYHEALRRGMSLLGDFIWLPKPAGPLPVSAAPHLSQPAANSVRRVHEYRITPSRPLPLRGPAACDDLAMPLDPAGPDKMRDLLARLGTLRSNLEHVADRQRSFAAARAS